MPGTGPWGMIGGMRGSLTKVTDGGAALENYLDALGGGGVFEGYLGGGIRFERLVGGAGVEDRVLQKGGLTMLLAGKDPTSGETLKKFLALKAGRKPQVRAYEIPINDSKELNTASVAFEDVRAAYMAAQQTGAAAVKGYLAGHLTVRLRDGRGGRTWVRPDEIMFASVTHFTSRDGDPQLHQHLELVNRVRVGGKWYAVDSVRLFGMYENIRSVYETAVYGDRRLAETLRAHGMSLDMDGRIPELGGAADVFGKRRHEIQERYGQLVAEWKAGHGENVPDGMLMRLKIQAWQETRRAKGEDNTRVDYRAWNAELKAAGYDLEAMLSGRTGRPRADAAAVYDAATGDLCALNAVHELSGMRSAWSMQDIEVAAYRQIRRMNVTGTPAELAAIARDITARAARMCESLEDDPRADRPWVRRLTSHAVIECEEELRGRLAARGAERTADPDLGPIAREYTLDPGQRKAMETICKGDPLAVVEGAAGAGKTHMLKAVKAHCDLAGRRLVIAAPMKKAAIVAHDETGADTCTVMKLLEAYGYRHDEASGTWSRVEVGGTDFRGNTYRGVPDAFRMDADTLLVVDEAGMTDQEQALRLLRVADETGARITLMGDTMQKGAVGRGGVLAMARLYAENSVDMADIHRFEDPDYAEFTLRLRDHSEATAPALARELMDRGLVHASATDEATVAAIADEWMRRPGTTVSTATNRQADMLNAAIQARRLGAGQLGSRSVQGMVAGEAIREGDTVMCRRNDEKAGVANRQLLAVRAIHAGGGMTLVDAEGAERRVTGAYVRRAVQLGYASTTYGAQGITSDRAIYWAAPGADGADMYVALTRGRRSNDVYLAAADRADALETLEAIIGRSSGDMGLEAARRDLRAQIEQSAPRDPARGRLERLENFMRDSLDAAEMAAAMWSRYLAAQGREKALEADAERAGAEAREARADLDAARGGRPVRLDLEAEYTAALRADPAYRAALADVRADAGRLAGAEAEERGLRDRMRRLNGRNAVMRRLEAGRRAGTADALARASREADALRREWTAKWGEAPAAAGDRQSLERIARTAAAERLDPAGEAGRLRALVEGRETDLEERAAKADARAADLEKRAGEARESTADALADVPAWYRTADRRAAREADCTAIRDALAATGDAERLKRLEETYRRITGREFEPAEKPARAPERKPAQAAPSARTATARRTGRPRTAPDPYSAQAAPLPMPSPAGMAMPSAGPASGPDLGI